MSIEYNGDTAVFMETVSVDEAESFLEWITEHKNVSADLSKCVHVHTAVLQVLMASDIRIDKLPEDRDLNSWIQNALKISKEN